MDEDLPPYEELMSVQSLAGLSTDAALDHIGKLADRCHVDRKPDGLTRAVQLAKDLERRELTPVQSATLDYFVANCWGSLKEMALLSQDDPWLWEQAETEHEILHLRRAFSAEGFSELPALRQCQVLTNLGNSLDHIGRFIDAIEYWDAALAIGPSFAMARGNRGHGLTYYARSLYDKGQRIVLMRSAHRDLMAALSLPLDEEARTGFRATVHWIESVLDPTVLHEDMDLDACSLGDSGEEREYREWCLQNRLFLNPLNDLGTYSIGARDVFTGPSIVVREGKGLSYVGFFNQMKQEYVSARYMYYEGITATEPHFSDKHVLLYNTLDYPCYSLAVEKIKSAFRAFYSIFDKISCFLNEYLRLGIDRDKTSFRTFWYKSWQKEKILRDCFQGRQNWPLRGLFWLSKDLYEDRQGFKEVMQPDAQELWHIRNHMEHKYLKVHSEMWPRGSQGMGERPVGMCDTLARSLCRGDFEEKTVRLMKMARAALIYLSLAVRCEEQQRADQRKAGDVILPLPLDTWEDEWKT